MKKIKDYENFEIDDYENKKTTSESQSHFKVKIFVLLILIIFFEIIYLICINSYVNKKNSELLQLNFKKYILDEGNEKLYSTLNEYLFTKYSLDEEIQRKEREIKIKEEQIKECKIKSSNLLQYYTPTTENLVKTKESNNKKLSRINELKSIIDNENKEFRYKYNTNIIDSISELNSIKSLVKNNNLQLCYKGNNNEINYSEAYEKCWFDENIPILIIFQSNIYERYGAFISNIKEKYSSIFSLNYGKIQNIKFIDLNNTQKQNLIYIIDIIKNMIFEKEHNIRNNIKDFIITDLEIFQIPQSVNPVNQDLSEKNQKETS